MDRIISSFHLEGAILELLKYKNKNNKSEIKMENIEIKTSRKHDSDHL